MMESSNVHAVTQTFQSHQDRLMALSQLVGHVSKHRIRRIGRAIRADWTPGQITTQGQILLTTKCLVRSAANVRPHNGL